MRKIEIVITASLFCFPNWSQAKTSPDGVAETPTIIVTKLDMTDKTLVVSYEIRNASDQDIWILSGFGSKNNTIFEVLVDADDRTLLMQTRLDFPMVYISLHDLHGRYVLLRAGQTRTESVILAVPVHPACPFGGGGRKQAVEQATRLAINIGYYDGDLPKMIWDVIQKPDTIGNRSRISHKKLMNDYFTGPLEFNWVNESLKERDEEILIPHTDQYLQYEKTLYAVVEDLAIPYDEKFDIDTLFELESPDIPQCTRIEIEFRPSMLEYYFPHAGQQSLLSDSERQTLRSSRSVIVTDQQQADAFVSDINEMIVFDAVVRQTSLAHVVCYREDEALASFDVFNDNSIVTEACKRYAHTEDSWSLRKFTPEIEPFELRVQCAANLRNLWHRLWLNYEARKASPLSPAGSSGQTEISYPVPTDWCDALVRACRTVKRPYQNITKMSNQDIIGPAFVPALRKPRSISPIVITH